ncbi:DUF1737 domain-containing protein [Martelella sp. AMO21009]|jgi:hypothetical protein|tara:strand:- start:314 stop:553 length:240 start_codon:yes stop_codon:yes gene_type:complete
MISSRKLGILTMRAYRLLTGVDDAAFCHRITEALNLGWSLHGSPVLTYDGVRQAVTCGQAITKDVPDRSYEPSMDLSQQ